MVVHTTIFMVTLEKLVDELKKFPADSILLVLIDIADYTDANLSIMKHFLNDKSYSGIYITLNKPYRKLMEIFQGDKIDTSKLFFIDSITNTAGGTVQRTDKCLFLSSPQELTDMSIAISELINALPEGNKFLMFDSLSTLAIYNPPDIIARFIHFLANKLRTKNVEGVLLSTKGERNEKSLSLVAQFCDKIIEVEG